MRELGKNKIFRDLATDQLKDRVMHSVCNLRNFIKQKYHPYYTVAIYQFLFPSGRTALPSISTEVRANVE